VGANNKTRSNMGLYTDKWCNTISRQPMALMASSKNQRPPSLEAVVKEEADCGELNAAIFLALWSAMETTSAPHAHARHKAKR
jgi:hypothetical protein